MKFWSK
jgi:hypothetical protein